MQAVQERRDALECPDGPISLGSLSMLSGPHVTMWSAAAPGVDTLTNTELRLEPDRPVILGRSEGWPVPYMDPAYRATTMIPASGQTLLLHDGHGVDIAVSRGHLMLRFAARGILVVNGVPRRGGGIRPPLNGTLLVRPVLRRLAPCEEYLIERYASVVLCLPNRAQIQIAAA